MKGIDRSPAALAIFALLGLMTPGYAGQEILRGDANHDGAVNLADPVFTLNFLFSGGPPPVALDEMDANDDGRVNIADPIALLTCLLIEGGDLPSPGMYKSGLDPTPDDLDAEAEGDEGAGGHPESEAGDETAGPPHAEDGETTTGAAASR